MFYIYSFYRLCLLFCFFYLIFLNIEILTFFAIHSINTVCVFLGYSGATTLGRTKRVLATFYFGLPVKYCIHKPFRIII